MVAANHTRKESSRADATVAAEPLSDSISEPTGRPTLDLTPWLFAVASSVESNPPSRGKTRNGPQRQPERETALQTTCEWVDSLVTVRDAPIAPALALAAVDRLEELRLGPDALAAALICLGIREGAIDAAALDAASGPANYPATTTLARGVLRMTEMEALGQQGTRTASDQSERLKNLLLAMVEDVRVVLIDLILRLEALRQVDPDAPGDAIRAAELALGVFAPLASRLGIGRLKWELEDLAFRVLEPQTYRSIAKQLEARRSERETYIDGVVAELSTLLANEGVARAEISGRPKHIHGIVRKMRKKGVDFDQIFDASALRVLVEDVGTCYAVLGHVHARWAPIGGEFDDYIARPKPNGYSSLHTAVVGPGGKSVEIQIRTWEMHQQAEFGVAAHWRYKESGQSDVAPTTSAPSAEAKATWLRQVLDWSENDDLGEIDVNLLSERVYVLTPQGDILDLPEGATPLDFAYQVHTDIGHRCRGAKVNGVIVQLTHKLRSGDRVEVLTINSSTPSRDWLNPHLGYLRSPRSRAKVRQWFKQRHFEQNRLEGLTTFNREITRIGLENVDRAALAGRFHFGGFDDLMAALGRGDVSWGQLLGALQALLPRTDDEPPESPAPTNPKPRRARKRDGIEIEGVGNLLTTVARCCHPVPPQPIVGYVTRGRGVSIHRADCKNVLQVEGADRSRVLDVQWAQTAEDTYPVQLELIAYDRRGLLRDITTVISAEQVNVAALHAGGVRDDETLSIFLTVEVHSLPELGRVLDRLKQVRNVVDASAKAQN